MTSNFKVCQHKERDTSDRYIRVVRDVWGLNLSTLYEYSHNVKWGISNMWFKNIIWRAALINTCSTKIHTTLLLKVSLWWSYGFQNVTIEGNKLPEPNSAPCSWWRLENRGQRVGMHIISMVETPCNHKNFCFLLSYFFSVYEGRKSKNQWEKKRSNGSIELCLRRTVTWVFRFVIE